MTIKQWIAVCCVALSVSVASLGGSMDISGTSSSSSGAQTPVSVTTPFVDAGWVSSATKVVAGTQVIAGTEIVAGSDMFVSTGHCYYLNYPTNTQSVCLSGTTVTITGSPVVVSGGVIRGVTSGGSALDLSAGFAQIVTGGGQAGMLCTNSSSTCAMTGIFNTTSSVSLASGCITSSGGTNHLDCATVGGTNQNFSMGTNGILTLGPGTGKLAVSTNAIFVTAPTISSGFGSSPTIVASNGSLAFEVDVGTGGSASSGVIGLPTASTGWNCRCDDITTNSSSVFVTKQTASSTSTCTVGNFNTSAAATAWASADKLRCIAAAY